MESYVQLCFYVVKTFAIISEFKKSYRPFNYPEAAAKNDNHKAKCTSLESLKKINLAY